MSKTRKKLSYLKSSNIIKDSWQNIKTDQVLSTREKLEKLLMRFDSLRVIDIVETIDVRVSRVDEGWISVIVEKK